MKTRMLTKTDRKILAECRRSMQWTREQVAAGNFSYCWGRSGIPGTQTIEAVHFTMAMPLGTIWYSFADDESLFIMQMFVHADLRRLGIARFLIEKLWECHPHLDRMVTGGVTVFSLPALRALGFTKTKAGWECRRKDRK